MTSDSSDEENLELLKEAQDTQFLNNSLFSESPGKSSDSQERKPLPSLRKTRDEDQQFNFFKVTPEFRDHVARQLTKTLDRKLKKRFADIEAPEIRRKKRKKGGVKLLSDSEHFVKIGKETVAAESSSTAAHNSKAKLSKTQEDNSNISEEALKEVAVSAEDILSKKEVKNWSSRKKAPVVHYKKTKHGQLELVEPETE